jgi:hypothetical protein
MENQIERLRNKYTRFKSGKESVLAVRDVAILVLDEAKKRDKTTILDEVQDMLIDLEFAIEENKCNGHRKHSTCC